MKHSKIAAGALAVLVAFVGIGAFLTPKDYSITADAASSGTVDSLNYMVYDDHVEITGFDNTVTNVIIPEKIEDRTVTIIASKAFYGSTRLERVYMPDTITTIESSAFEKCSALETIGWSNSLKSIGKSSFANCTMLQKIILPSLVETIGDSAFSNCTSLSELRLPKGLISCGSWLCYADANLSRVIIENGPVNIGFQIFGKCTSLEQIYIPLSVTDIDTTSFSNAVVKNVYYAGNAQQWAAVTHHDFGYLANAIVHYSEPAPNESFFPETYNIVTADVNKDGNTNASDAALILIYAAYVGAGGTDDIATYLSNRS